MALDILFVDDDLITREVVSRHLRLRGHRVEIGVNGIDALARTGKTRFDVVISDFEMPEMGGLDLLIRLRQEQPLARVIVLTGHVEIRVVMSCLREGAFSFLAKPLGDCSELDRHVDQAGWLVDAWRSQLSRMQRLAREEL